MAKRTMEVLGGSFADPDLEFFGFVAEGDGVHSSLF